MLQRSLLLMCLGAASSKSGSTFSTSGPASLLVMSLQAHDHAFSIPWSGVAQQSVKPCSTPTSPASQTDEVSRGDLRTEDRYESSPRSPYSVMRAKRTRVGRCAANLLPQQTNVCIEPAHSEAVGKPSHACCAGKLPWCCCSALAYPTTGKNYNVSMTASSEPGPLLHTTDTEEDRYRDAFVLGLKLSGTEETLRAVIGETAYTLLVGPNVARSSRTIALCADPTPLLTNGDAPAPSANWTARTLLSTDEENRVKWLWEETGDFTQCYNRAPTLQALFVMWTLATAASSTATPPTLDPDAAAAKSGALSGKAPLPSQQQQQSTPMPKVADIEQVYQRMVDHQVDLTLCDMAALITFAGAADSHVQDFVVRLMVRTLSPERITEVKSRHGLVSTDLDFVLVLTALCQYVRSMRDSTRQEAAPQVTASPAASPQPLIDGDSTDKASGSSTSSSADYKELSVAEETRLLTLVRIAGKISELRVELGKVANGGTTPVSTKPSGARFASEGGAHQPPQPLSIPHATTITKLIDTFIAGVRGIAAGCSLPSTSTHVAELTVWLLREMPSSPACYRHYQTVVDHSPMDALVMLEKSGLLGKRHVDLNVVNRVILPLLEHCGNEDFFTLVMRDVIGLLEDRLRRDPHSFTDADMRLLAELGAKLFAHTTAADGAAMGGAGNFDTAAREQMEELHVMDGSPWALCVSSYRSLKEILQNLVRDHRKLKRQVQEQMRNIGIATGGVLLGTSGASGAGGHDSVHGGASPDGRVDGSAPKSPESGAAGANGSATPATGGTGASGGAVTDDEEKGRSRMIASPVVRNRFLVFVEDLVKELVDDNSANSERPIVISSELFAFVNKHVPVPNIQDEYRRKIFLLVNVAEDPDTVRRRRRELRRKKRLEAMQKAEEYDKTHGGKKGRGGSRRRQQPPLGSVSSATMAATATDKGSSAISLGAEVDEDADADTDTDLAGDLHGGAEEIPAELRFLVSSLPLTLSPWASVMILREVLAESAGRNPRYTYVLNAAIDLQLPISTTRSRIATTLNMWRFLNSQSHKLTLKESVVMKQRCVFNLPLSYILSSYWSLLTSLIVACIILLNVVGLDFESQLVANSLFQKFTPWEEVVDVGIEPWNAEAAADLASSYFEQDEIASKHRPSSRRSSDVILSSASYLFLGYDDQRRPMTLIPISSDPKLSEEARTSEEYACAAAVLRELSLHAPFPFYLDLERPMSVEYVETRVAERIRRVSFNNTWFLPRMIIRTFPLGRQYTERMLITHTCSQANLTRRRITFLIYVEDGVPVTQQFLRGLQDSFLSQSANLVLVVHERSLHKGGTTPRGVEEIAAAGRAGTSGLISPLSTSPPASVVEGDNTNPSTLRVMPYCRQLHDIPAGFFDRLTRQADRLSKSRRRRWRRHGGSDDLGSAKALLQSFSPFARHFALRIPADDDSEQGRRRFVGEQPEKERGVLSTVVGDTFDVMVGATAATVNLAVMPFRVALRTTGRLFGVSTDESAAGREEEGLSQEVNEEMGIPYSTDGPSKASVSSDVVHTRPADSQRTPAPSSPSSSARAAAAEGDVVVGPSYPRKVISVPFSLVKEAMGRAASTGQSAMRWLGDDKSTGIDAASETAGGKSKEGAGRGDGKVDLKKEMGLTLNDEDTPTKGTDPHSGAWGLLSSGWGVVRRRWNEHRGESGLQQRPQESMWWIPSKETCSNTSLRGNASSGRSNGEEAVPSERCGDGQIPSLHPSVSPMMTPWERHLWGTATTSPMSKEF